MTAPPRFESRPATLDDFAFVWSLYVRLMRAPTEELIPWNEAGQRAVVQAGVAAEGSRIILVAERDAGWLQVRRGAAEIELLQLYLLPDVQNRGVGGAILLDLQDEARRRAIPLTLQVMTNNRARWLYERHGLRVAGGTVVKHLMRWEPS